MVIETETLSRIVIEKDEISDAETPCSGDTRNSGARQRWVVNGRSAGSAGAEGIDSSGVVRGIGLKVLSEADVKRFQSRFALLLWSGVILALLVAVGAIWLYQSRSSGQGVGRAHKTTVRVTCQHCKNLRGAWRKRACLQVA